MSLQAKLQIAREGRQVTFTVTVRNGGSDPAVLQFTDAGTLQVIATAPDGTQRYDSRAGRMFAQLMKTVTVAPGADVTFSDRWTAPPEVSGTLRVRATVRSTPALTATGTLTL